MKNKKTILDTIIEARSGHYCHVIEVDTVYDIENIVESIYSEFIDNFSASEILDFFNTIQVYALDDDNGETNQNETEIYDFNFEKFITELN